MKVTSRIPLKESVCVKVLQEDDDSLSPNEKTEVSPVSQAWFTTKEDKDTLTNKGTNSLQVLNI